MKELSYRRHRFPPVVIQHAVWLYLRFTLSYRDVEDLLAERGLDVSYETVRSWVLKFGPVIARRLRRRRPRPSNPGRRAFHIAGWRCGHVSLGVGWRWRCCSSSAQWPRPMHRSAAVMAAGKITSNRHRNDPRHRRHRSCPRYGHGWKRARSYASRATISSDIRRKSPMVRVLQHQDRRPIATLSGSRLASRILAHDGPSRTQIVTTDESKETWWTNSYLPSTPHLLSPKAQAQGNDGPASEPVAGERGTGAERDEFADRKRPVHRRHAAIGAGIETLHWDKARRLCNRHGDLRLVSHRRRDLREFRRFGPVSIASADSGFKARGTKVRGASPLEEGGFELVVPLSKRTAVPSSPFDFPSGGGTGCEPF